MSEINLKSHFDPPRADASKALEAASWKTEDFVEVQSYYGSIKGEARFLGSESREKRWDVVVRVDVNALADRLSEDLDGVDAIWVVGTPNSPDHDYSSAPLLLLDLDVEDLDAFVEANQIGAYEAVDAASVSALGLYEAGATPATEIAHILASGLATMRDSEDGAQDWAKEVRLICGVGTAVFEEIAKLRALRWCWAKLTGSLGLSSKPRIHAVAGMRTLSVSDVWSNALRTSTQGFAAAIGGADAITLTPHNASLTDVSETERLIAQRLSATGQKVLELESFLAFVEDPSEGSYALEALTEGLARKAWELFQAIEKKGGMSAVAMDGTLWEQIESANARRDQAYATRQSIRVGVNEYALEEVVPSLAESDGQFAPYTEAHEWEALRANNSENRPRVFLANIGAIPRHKARAEYATNLFTAGGFEVIGNEGFEDAASMALAYQASGASGAVICGHNDDYEDLGSAFAKAFEGEFLVLAGKADTAVWEPRGVGHFVFQGADVLEILTRISEVAHG